MFTDPVFYILFSALLGFAFGALAGWLPPHLKLRRISKETWRAARTFYEHRGNSESQS